MEHARGRLAAADVPDRQATATDGDKAVLRAAGITKSFGHVRALDGVGLSIEPGEILAIVGDNGAGKSTLLNVLAGAYAPDSGEIQVRGQPVRFRTPADARRSGIGAVFQELALVECLDVATNVFLGDLPRRGPFVRRAKMDRETGEILARMGIEVGSPRTPVGMLPAGHRQLIAVARAIRSDSEVIAMDEPTASLGVSEKAHVADILRRLTAEGRAVIVVSHDLDLVFDIADRIQVLRLGCTVAVRDRSETDRDEIVGMITGART